MMRKVAYFLAIVFLAAATAALVMFIVALQGARQTVKPIGDLVRKLVVEATPVILPSPAIIVEEISDLARLETQQYAFQDIIQVERNPDVLFGAFGESLLFVAFGEVVAGVDLAQLRPADVQVTGPASVVIHLPAAEIFFARLDNERSYVANRDEGLLASQDPQLETLVRQEAEARMLEAALANGILEQADMEAENVIRDLLLPLGFTDVTFVGAAPSPITPSATTVPKGFIITPGETPTPIP